MATPFQTFVNGELPKRPFTQDAAVTWTQGRVLVTTGVALGVTTEVFPAPPVTSVNDNTGAVVLTADSLSAIPTSQKGAASGVASLDANGFVPLSQMNPGVVERLYVVTDETARFALTTAQVQNGDVVKQELPAPAAMYYVQDDTNLGSELGYAIFAVGTAAAVAWSGVTGIPQVLLDLENISGAVTGDILQFNGLNWIKQSRDTYVAGLDLQTSDIEGLDTVLGEKQAHDLTLDALSNLPDLGFIVQIAEDSFTSRELEAGDGINITYPNGVDGNPLIALAEGPSEAQGTHGDENTYLGLDIDSHGRTTLVTAYSLQKDTVYIPNSTDMFTLATKTLYMIGDYVTNTYGELNLQLPILTTEALIEIQVAFTVQSISQVNLTPNGVDLIFGQSASVDINTVLPLLPGCVLRLFYHSVGLGWVASVLYSDNVSSLHVHQTNSTSFTNKHVITSDATEYRTLSIPDANLSLGDVITQLTFDRDTDVLTGLRSDTTEVTTLFNQGYLDELFNPDGVSLSTPLKVGRTYRIGGTIQVHPAETPVYLPAATADAFNSHESMPIKIIMRDDVLDSGYLHLTPQFGDDLMYATVSGVVSSGGNEVPIPNHSVVTCYMVQAGTWYVEVKQDSTYLDTDHFSIVDPLDRTKSVKLNVAPVSTDTQRTITVPDADLSLGKIPTGVTPNYTSGKLMVPLADGTSIPLSTFGGTHLTGPNTPATQLAANGHYFFYVDTGSQYTGVRQLSLPESPTDLTYIRLSNLCSVSAFATGAGATIAPGGSDKINGVAATLDITQFLTEYQNAVITLTYSVANTNWTVSVAGDLIKPGTVAIYDADKTNTTTLTPVSNLTTNRIITLPDANVDLGKVLSNISYAPTTGVITLTNVDASTFATTNIGAIADDMLRIQATGAATKKMGFNCSAVTAGQTRIVTMPDANVDLGKVAQAASNLADGYLTGTDWNTFNSKEQAGYITVSSSFTAQLGKKYRTVYGLNTAITITPPVTTTNGASFTVFYSYMTSLGSVSCTNPNISADAGYAWQEFEYTYDAAAGGWLHLRKSLGVIVPAGAGFQLTNPTNPNSKCIFQLGAGNGLTAINVPSIPNIDLGNLSSIATTDSNTLSGTRNRIVGGSGNNVSGTDNVVIGCSGGTGASGAGRAVIILANKFNTSSVAALAPHSLVLGTSAYDPAGQYWFAGAVKVHTALVTQPETASGSTYSLTTDGELPSSTNCLPALLYANTFMSARHEFDIIITFGEDFAILPTRTFYAKRTVYVARRITSAIPLDGTPVLEMSIATPQPDVTLGLGSNTVTINFTLDATGNRLIPTVAATSNPSFQRMQVSCRVDSHYNRK